MSTILSDKTLIAHKEYHKAKARGQNLKEKRLYPLRLIRRKAIVTNVLQLYAVALAGHLN
jgi:hypothetical protein